LASKTMFGREITCKNVFNADAVEYSESLALFYNKRGRKLF